MWRFGPNDAASCVIIDILFFHCSFVDMLNIISTCRDILCVDINVDKRCVDHSTRFDLFESDIQALLIFDPLITLWGNFDAPYPKLLNDASVASACFYVRTCRRVRNSKKIVTIRDFHLPGSFLCLSTRLQKCLAYWNFNAIFIFSDNLLQDAYMSF